ncbi:MAG TPA: YfhL family 4Fe-4S dicluster ferredoxin [Candidatus Binatia bacterium]|nr:YfhL family 4Fe-4S dicluster ferredoxin [Candidatus Binatia bacterium]
MATMITNDCINCGACEPECPNNAISQGDPVYVIDPKLCTECVGFHDYEACAAVCPVDVCVTDPNNIESEEVLIARARVIHPEITFGDSFESRFRKGEGKAAVGASPAAPAQGSQAAAPGAAPATAAPATTAVATGAFAEADVNYIELPEIDSWTIPMRCYKCNEVHVENVKNFMIGNVIFCPNCNKSVVVRDNLNYHIRTLLKDAYEKWQHEQSEFAAMREQERAEFIASRAKEAAAFENHQQNDLAKIREQLDAIGENYDAAGRPYKKGSRFSWG